MVIDHKLGAANPLSIEADAFDAAATDALLNDTPLNLEEVSRILTL